ncbi:hypothetical protein BLS_004628 [Venturia inaequalis]|uniref:Uncharacterized protein n=1 Tax=Venturia inaequalis TaxID=5025 RepID=A0A8H3YHZ5_VENIN|nr:hypothetical protein BLS_004628 [Venturia inaequalis]
MRLTSTLLAAILAPSIHVSANSYKLCCCTKPTYPDELPDSRYYVDDPQSRYIHKWKTQCTHAATQTIVDAIYGHFVFTTHFWEGYKGTPRFKGQDYIYATAINGDDSKIGPKEMEGWCARQKTGRYCWTPNAKFGYNYTGESLQNNGIK